MTFLTYTVKLNKSMTDVVSISNNPVLVRIKNIYEQHDNYQTMENPAIFLGKGYGDLFGVLETTIFLIEDYYEDDHVPPVILNKTLLKVDAWATYQVGFLEAKNLNWKGIVSFIINNQNNFLMYKPFLASKDCVEEIKRMYDEYIEIGFTPEQAINLLPKI